MALFRQQRSSLEESLKTTVIVKDVNALEQHLRKLWSVWCNPQLNRSVLVYSDDYNPVIKIEPYCGFDERCGWYTQMVTSNILDKDKFVVEAFLSEPLDE